ncbi:MAG TPA: UvrD-helicase domain-containing protein, partial [Hanamia sp.]
NFRAFEQWFNRHAQQVKINEPYRVYEEFKGVLTGSPLHTAYLSREEYLALGIKQSIFTQDKRELVYGLFARYLQWMKENNFYDSNMLSFEYLELVKPRYDYIMIDEVQDITGIQLKCIMQSLVNNSHFILTGDSNQIVHPNFFSWSKIKTYLYHHGTDNKQVRILQTNYRNSHRVVELSNTLLKIKNLRFGSIDKESNYLINTISSQKGEVLLMQDNDKVKAELNKKTKDSIQYAVVVADNTLKDEARKYFKTPLIFSVQEAKGLEYENVILLNFISANPAEFKEIINGVDAANLLEDDLKYARPSDKSNKDAEVYKFYINSFYVAITRSVKNIYLFESQVNHPALGLLSLKEMTKPLQVAEQKSDKEEWLEEARRLEEQGKYEQAEQIRAKYLGYEYISPEQLEQIKILALDPAKKEQEVKKERKQLFQYAVTHHRLNWISQLANLQFQRAMLYMKELRQDGKEYAKHCRLGHKEEVKRIVRKYSADFAFPDDNVTGLMVALRHGQDAAVDLLLELEADVNKQDASGLMAIDHLLLGYYKNSIYRESFTAGKNTLIKYWHSAKPSFIPIQQERRRLNIGAQSMAFFLLVCMRCIHQEMPNTIRVSFPKDSRPDKIVGEFSMDEVMQFVEIMPDEILPLYRRQRSYVNSVLAGNEMDRLDTSNKKLFKRTKRGCYILNPQMQYQIDAE